MTAGTKRSTHMKAGTPGFQAPEQLNGINVGPHSDIYALGCIVLELFTEQPVWRGLSAHTIMFHVGVKGEYPTVDNVDKRACKILECCFKDATERKDAVCILNIICDILLEN